MYLDGVNSVEDIRVGVVGVGHLGRVHARIYKELMGAKLVGVVDSNAETAQEIGSLYDVPSYDNVEQFVREQHPEAISVVVPTTQHFDIACALAEQGIHLIVEKPVTTTVEQASRLLEVAKRKNIVLQVGHVERFNSAIRYLAQQVREDPLLIQARRQGPFSPRVGDVGVVLDLMIHDIDIILSLVKSDIMTINAMGRKVRTSHEDFAVAQIKFKSGAVAEIQASRVAERRMRQMDVMLNDKYYSVNFETQDVTIYHAPQTSPSGGTIEIIEHPLLPKSEPLKQELSHFVTCIKEGRQPLVGISDGKRALQVAVEVLRQIHSLN